MHTRLKIRIYSVVRSSALDIAHLARPPSGPPARLIKLRPRPAGASSSPLGASSLTRPETLSPPYPGQLEIGRRNDADGVTLVVRGEIDLASAPALARELRDARSRPARRIVIDLADLEFIDSTGIHALIQAQLAAELDGHELVLTHVPPQTQRLFSLTGINERFNLE